LSNKKKINQGNSKSADPDFAGCKNNSFIHFKCYNLAIYVIKFFEKNSTRYLNSPRQDPIVGPQEKEFNLIYAIRNWGGSSGVLFCKT
jgi:hypothetical protein